MKNNLDCPYCDGKADLKNRKAKLEFRKDHFPIHQFYYQCGQCMAEFSSSEIDELMLEQVYNQYREKYKIPFPAEITAIREKYQLSAAKMSQVLGLGVNSYSNFEKGEIPSISIGNLIRSAGMPAVFRNYLLNAKDHFSDNAFSRTVTFVSSIAKDENPGDEKLFLQDNQQYASPNQFNGFQTPDLGKIINLVSYFLKNCEPAFNDRIKLNILFFYTDFLNYQRSVRSVTGLSYRVIASNPVPNYNDTLFEILQSEGRISAKISVSEDGNAVELFTAEAPYTMDVFNETEKETINYILDAFGKLSSGEIMAQQLPVINFANETRELISYQEYAFDIKQPLQVATVPVKKNSAGFKPKLFFSYEHGDNIQPVRQYLKSTFLEVSEEQFDIIDSDGVDHNTIVNSIDDCFGAVLLLTPGYKQRVLAKKGWVYEEYMRILKNKERKREHFTIYPFVVSGTFPNSIPQEIEDTLTLNLSGLRFQDGLPLKDRLFNLTITHLYKTIRYARENAPFGNEDYVREKNKVYKVLFEQTKADFKNVRNIQLIEQIIVLNNALRKVKDCETLIIKGRKGSGKSTLTQVVPYIYRHKFLTDMPVNANRLNLDSVFALMIQNAEVHIAANVQVKRKEIFKLGWKYFIHLMYMDALLLMDAKNDKSFLDMEEKEQLIQFFSGFYTDYQNTLSYNYISREERYDQISHVLFPYSINRVVDFMEHIKKRLSGNPSHHPSEWSASFTEQGFFFWCFTDQLRQILENCTQKIKYTDKKILFSLDNFDNDYYEQRKSIVVTDYEKSFKAEELTRLAAKDTDLLFSLVQIVNDVHTGNQSTHFIFSVFNFCITIPEDLYLDIEKLNRDSYRFINKVYDLNWTGIELLILLRKHLEKYTGNRIPKYFNNGVKKPQEVLLTQIFKNDFPGLPEFVDVEFNHIRYQVPLFIYILRHTFWRPREILIFYGDIISIYNTSRQRGLLVTSDDLRVIVRKNTRHIIEHEFLNEFDTHCVNIEDIFSRFRNKPQTLSYQNLYEIIGSIEFRFTYHTKNAENSFADKILFLYKTGFLGVILSTQKAEENNLYKYSFIFNSGLSALTANRLGDEEDFADHMFIIHPIFCEYLKLDPERNEEFVLNFSFEYLHDQDKFFTLLYG